MIDKQKFLIILYAIVIIFVFLLADYFFQDHFPFLGEVTTCSRLVYPSLAACMASRLYKNFCKNKTESSSEKYTEPKNFWPCVFTFVFWYSFDYKFIPKCANIAIEFCIPILIGIAVDRLEENTSSFDMRRLLDSSFLLQVGICCLMACYSGYIDGKGRILVNCLLLLAGFMLELIEKEQY